MAQFSVLNQSITQWSLELRRTELDWVLVSPKMRMFNWVFWFVFQSSKLFFFWSHFSSPPHIPSAAQCGGYEKQSLNRVAHVTKKPEETTEAFCVQHFSKSISFSLLGKKLRSWDNEGKNNFLKKNIVLNLDSCYFSVLKWNAKIWGWGLCRYYSCMWYCLQKEMCFGIFHFFSFSFSTYSCHLLVFCWCYT